MDAEEWYEDNTKDDAIRRKYLPMDYRIMEAYANQKVSEAEHTMQEIINALSKGAEVKRKRIEELEKQAKCYHSAEVQHQGNGFIYTVCKDCGLDLDNP